MSFERATAWVVACDTPNCRAIAVSDSAHTTRPQGRSGRYMLLADKADALISAKNTGWVTGPDYSHHCPAHADTEES